MSLSVNAQEDMNNNVNANKQWISIGDGLPLNEASFIYSVIEFNKKIYVGGCFLHSSQAFAYVSNGYNQKNPKWTWVGKGLPGTVIKFAVGKNVLYAMAKSFKQGWLIYSYNGNDQSPNWAPISIAGLPSDPNFMWEYKDKGITVFKDKMYLFCKDRGIFVYDDQKQLWSEVSPVNKENRFFLANAMVVFHDKLYVGGITEVQLPGRPDLKKSTSVYVYNGNDHAPNWTWISDGLPGLPEDFYASGNQVNALNVLNNTLYVAGSSWRGGLHEFIYAYNGNDKMPKWNNVGDDRLFNWASEISFLTTSGDTVYALLDRDKLNGPFIYAYNNTHDPKWESVTTTGLPKIADHPNIKQLVAFDNVLYMNMSGSTDNTDGAVYKEFFYALPLLSSQQK